MNNITNTPLSKCFFIVDEYSRLETALESELVTYFYPKTVDPSKQANLASYLSFLPVFIPSMSSSKVRVVETKTLKLALKEVGKYFISLTSPTYCSNHSLSEHLDIFIRAIHFYCKDFDSIEKKAKDDRLKLIQEFENVCQLITPLIDQFHNDIDESFKPTKYKEFYGFAPVSGSVTTSRFFVMASEIISSLCEIENILGACVLYTDRVLCTYFDNDTTKFITNLILFKNPQENMTTVMDVYIENHALKLLLDTKNVSFEDLGFDKEEKNIKVVLYVYKVGQLILAVIGTPSSFNDMNIVKNIESTTYDKLKSLDQSFSSLIRSGSVELKSSNGNITGPNSPILLSRSSSFKIRQTIDKSTLLYSSSPSLSHTQSSGSLKMSKNQQLNYDFLSYHSYTQESKSFISSKRMESKKQFYETICSIHDVFEDNPKISKILLRDHNGALLCRKSFGKETYFHQQRDMTHSIPSLKSVEDTSKEILGSIDHNIILL